MPSISCALCHYPLSSTSSSECVDLSFCCMGCQTVYRILEAQGALGSDLARHPLYQQAQQAGLLSRPYVPPRKEEEEMVPSEDFYPLHLILQHLWCPSCAQIIPLLLMREKGIKTCTVDYSNDLAFICYTPRFISKEKILSLLHELGYAPQLLCHSHSPPSQDDLMKRFIVALFFFLNVMMFAYPIYATLNTPGDGRPYAYLFAWLSLAGTLPVIGYSAQPIWHHCVNSLKAGVIGMEALVALGSGAAMSVSLYELLKGSSLVYFDSLTALIAFVLLGKLLEAKAKSSFQATVSRLSLALPRRGRKEEKEGMTHFVPITEFVCGDRLVVESGERIVLDGIIEKGTGSCDESLMTGEAAPVAKQPGDQVIGGTILLQGALTIKVARPLNGSTLHHLIEMVGSEIQKQVPYPRLIDRISRLFIPCVIAIGLFTAFICLWREIADPLLSISMTAFHRALSILLIACPCAIGLAIPLSESYLLQALAAIGVIVRNRHALPFLGRETVYLFDKTGTLTEGKFTIHSGLEEMSAEDQAALKGLVLHSRHPIALALNASLTCSPLLFDRIEEITGLGLQGTKGADAYLLGSSSFLNQKGETCSPPAPSSTLLTPVYFARPGKPIRCLLLGDKLRTYSPQLIASLAPIRSILLSGDASSAVSTVATACGISTWHANCSPNEKRERVEQLKKQGEIVAMLGDGVNDAPALAAAHIGIAVASASDFSLQSASLLLTTDHPSTLSTLRQLAHKGRRIAHQNLFWAFFYNGIGIALASVGLLNPFLSACAMVLSSGMIFLNVQRLRFFSSKAEK